VIIIVIVMIIVFNIIVLYCNCYRAVLLLYCILFYSRPSSVGFVGGMLRVFTHGIPLGVVNNVSPLGVVDVVSPLSVV